MNDWWRNTGSKWLAVAAALTGTCWLGMVVWIFFGGWAPCGWAPCWWGYDRWRSKIL